MQLHNLKRNTKNRRAKQVGRGGTRGKTAGRGTKGQNARAGRKKRPEMRDMIKKLPKLRGRGKNSFKSRKEKPAILNMSKLKGIFKDKSEVTVAALLERKLIKRKSGKLPKVKILNG